MHLISDEPGGHIRVPDGNGKGRRGAWSTAQVLVSVQEHECSDLTSTFDLLAQIKGPRLGVPDACDFLIDVDATEVTGRKN